MLKSTENSKRFALNCYKVYESLTFETVIEIYEIFFYLSILIW